MRTGRPPVSRSVMLDAAADLFAAAAHSEPVTMEAVASAAGVGKGTLFRAFGDRDGLLDALAAERFLALRTAVEHGEDDFAPECTAEQRTVAFLDAVLTFKLANRNLMRARETASASGLTSERYRWMHGVLSNWIAGTLSGRSPTYVAHALLAPLQIDLIDELLSGGLSVDDLRAQQAAQIRATLGFRG